MNEPLHSTLADAVALLRDEQLPYALIGGLAVSLRGQPRVTGDVDMVVATDPEQMLGLAARLDTTRFRPLFAGVEEVIQRSYILPLRHRHSQVKVDMAIGLSGFERQTVARAESVRLAGCDVSVATAEDLLLMKVLANRDKDQQDIEGLVVAQGSRLDWNYCVKVATELGEAIDQDLVSRIAALRDGDHSD